MQADRSVRQGAAQQSVQKKESSGTASAGMSMNAGVASHSPAAAGSQLSVQMKEQESVQFKGNEDEDKQEQSNQDVKDKAAEGVKGASKGMPHGAKIQEAFGKHDVSSVKSKTGGSAKEAADEIGADAYAQGENIAFSGTPDLHTAAHEAAHVMQQRAGKSPAGGVGKDGDDLEKEADEIADKVVQGESVETALDAMGEGEGEGDGDGEASGDDTQLKATQSKNDQGGGGMAAPPPSEGDAVQMKASGKSSDSGGGMAAAAPGGDDVQRKAVQKDSAGTAPEKITLRVGGIPVVIQLPKEFKGKTFTKSVSKNIAKGVNLTQVRVKFDDKWTIQSGSVGGNFAAKLGQKKLKTSWKLNVNKGGSVAGHVKDVPIEDGPLSGTLSASWAGKKLKATAKASISSDVKLGEVKGFGARFLSGTNANITFTHEKILKAKSTQASVMLTQKGEDRVKLTGKGSYIAPSKFDGDGDVDVIKPFEIKLPKLNLKSGKKSKGRFKFGSWSFKDLPLNINFGGGMLKSVMNKLKFGKLGLGGFGKFDIKNPFKLPTIGGWTPSFGVGTKLNVDFAKNLLKKLKGVADWKLGFKGKDVFSGLFKGISFDPKKWAFSGLGMGNLIGDFDLGSFGGFNFKGLGLGKKLKLPKLNIRNNALVDFLGKIDLGVFKGPKFAFGSLDLSWLKGKGLKKARGKFTFPSMPTFSMKPYSVKLDKDTTGDADFSNNKLNSVSGQVGAKLLKGDKEIAQGRLEKAHILVAKKKFTGNGSLNLLTEIPLAEKNGWKGTIEPTKGKTVAFKFANSDLKQAKGKLAVRVDKGAQKLVRVGADGTYNGKSFTGKGSAKLLAKLDFNKGKTSGSIKPAGTNLQAAHILKSVLKKATGTLAAEAKTDTKFGALDFTGTLKKGDLDLRKTPSITGDVGAKLKKEFTLGKDVWKTKILPKSAATVALKSNVPKSISGEPLNMQLIKDGKKAATIDAKAKLDLKRLSLDLNAKGKLHKGLELHDKPKTVIRRESTVDSLILKKNELQKAKGDIGIALNDKEGKPLGEGDLKGAWVKKQGFTGNGKFALKKEITLKKKGAYTVSLEPTKGATVDAKLNKSEVTQLKGELSVRVDKDGKKFARAKAKGTYNGKTFTGTGKGDLLANVPFKKGAAEGVVEAKGTKLTKLAIAANKFKSAEGSFSAKMKTTTKYGPLEFRGQVEKAMLKGGKDPSISGNVKATLLKDFTVGKGQWQTRLLNKSQVQIRVDNNKPISISGTPLKLYVLKDGKKAAHVDATSKFNLRTLVLDVSAKGTLYKGVQLLDKPRTTVSKDSPLEKLVIKANQLHVAKGSIDLQFHDKAEKLVGEGSLKGAYVKKQGFTGKGKFDIKSEIGLKKKGKHTVVLEPTKGPTVDVAFAKSKLKSFKGNIKARVDRDNKPLARAEAEGKYDGKNFTGKGKAKLLDNVTWTKKKTTVTLEKKGTEIKLLHIRNSAFVQAKASASVRFQRPTDNGKLDLRGKVKDANIDARKETSISGAVEATLLAKYTIGKGAWQTQVKKGAQATLKVKDSKLQTFATNKIGLLVLHEKKKAAEVNAKVKFNLRTLVLDASGDGKLFKDLELGKGPKVVVDKESKVNELVIKANAPNKIDGQVSLTVFDKKNQKTVHNAYLKGKWSKKAGFTGEGGGKTARNITAGKPDGYHAVLKKDSGIDKIKVAKGKFVEARGGQLGVAVHDKDGALLSGTAKLDSLVATPEDFLFSGSGGLKLDRTLKVGKKTGKGLRVVQGTEVGASVKDNKFTRITGQLFVGVDGNDGKEIATGSLEKVDVDMTQKAPIITGKGTVTTKKELKIGKLITVHKDLKASATVVKNELIEAGLENANFTIHKLNDGKGAKGKVKEAKLKFPKTGDLPDFSFLGGAVEDFKMLKGKLIGSLQQLSFKSMKFGGLGKATYKPNKVFTADASLRFDPTDKLMLPWVTLKGSVNMPLLKKKKFYERGMPGSKKWTLMKGGVTIKGVRAAMILTAGYELGTEPVMMEASLETAKEFNPEKFEFPDFKSKAKVTGEAYAKGDLTLDGRLGVGLEQQAYFGLSAKASLRPKLTATVVPSGSLYSKGGKLGGDLGMDFNVTGTAALKTSLDLIAEFLGMDSTLANFGKKDIDFGELFSFGWKGDWKFGEAEGKPAIKGDAALGNEKAIEKDTTKAFEEEKKTAGESPAKDFKSAPGGKGGDLKGMEEKMAVMKILFAMTKAGIKLIDMGVSSLPPGLGTLKSLVIDGKLLDASEACMDLTIEIDKAEESGLLKKLIDKGGALGKTMKVLKEYTAMVNALSGPSVKEMWDNSAGVANFTSNAMLLHVQVGNVSHKTDGARYPFSVQRRNVWHHLPLCTWSHVSSRGAMSHAAGFLEWTGAIDKGTDPLQEMSKKDWKRRLKNLKNNFKKIDEPHIYKYLPKIPKYTITD
jgi:hypothetical protein